MNSVSGSGDNPTQSRRRFKWVLSAFVLLLAGIAALAVTLRLNKSTPEAEPPGPPWFEDITEESGIRFVHEAGPVGTYFMPQQVGSGAAMFDADGDNLLDIYLLQNGGSAGPKNVLYLQTADHKFRDASLGSGLDIPGHNMGVAIGDVNNDGRPDVLVTQYTGLKLFLNQGNGVFLDATLDSGLSNPAWGTSAAFFDYDRDGRLDLVVVSYVDYDPTWVCTGSTGGRDYCAPKTFKGRVSRLYHNETRDGVVRFSDATESSGISRIPGPGLGVVCADFDGDGWPDVFIANDGAPNRLWMNQKNGTFREEAVQRGIAYNAMGVEQAGMGVTLGDVDGDGLFDIFVTHLSEETHTLWKQGPRGLFTDSTAAAGLIAPTDRGTGFGTLFSDFDNDGALDLAIVNGRVSARGVVTDRSLGPFWSSYGDHNEIYRGDGRGVFRSISRDNPAISGNSTISRGLVRGDIDGDGAQDLLVTSIAGPARLYRNVAPNRGHWLSVRALDPALKRDAIGAEIRVRVGDRTRGAWLNPAESYLCSSEPSVHFGLGNATHVDAIEVRWPDGKLESFEGCNSDRRKILNRGAGR